MYGSADQFRYQQRERVRAFARERFFPFYRRMFPTLAPEATFSGALHFRVLARALERVANGETRRLMIAIRRPAATVVTPRARLTARARQGQARLRSHSRRRAPLRWPDPTGATATPARPATPAPLCNMNSCPGANK
jgi:hypothetical protein